MIFQSIVRSSFFLACALAYVSAQDLLATPVERWTFQLTPEAELGPVEIQKGNGVFLQPNGTMAVVTTVGATAYAFSAYGGSPLWTYQALSEGTNIASCHSGVTFSSTGYLAFTVVDNENSLTPTTRVIALDMDGQPLWESEPLEGIPQGDPLISSDGSFVFVIHNEFDQETSVGTAHFTILDGDSAGEVFYTETAEGDLAFGPPGIFHMPIEGNYDPLVAGAPVSEGENNQNDFLMWSQTPKPTDTTIANGFIYGFQFPRTFTGNASDIGFFPLGEAENDFQAKTPPVITNDGLSAYWGVSRSSFRGWNSKRFSRARSVAAGFTRNIEFAGESVFAAPALSNDGPDPVLFGGSASNEFVRLTIDFAPTVVPTDAYIMSRAIVDGDERAVYYVEMNGNLHQADFDSLADIWNFTIGFAVEGEMALTSSNDLLIVADRRGVIRALEVSEIAATEAPSVFPSDMPSMAPSGGDASAPVATPTADEPTSTSGTDAPSAAGATDAPGVEGTEAPASAANRPMLFFAVLTSIACLFV